MLGKLKQQTITHNRTPSNRTPNLRSRTFILNYTRRRRANRTSGALRATLGFVIWLKAAADENEEESAFRAECFLTGRSRGTTQRYSITRTKVKEIVSKARLFGVQKSSW